MSGLLLYNICYKCRFENRVVQEHCQPVSVFSIHSSVNYASQKRVLVLNSLRYGHIGRDFIGITDRTKSSDKYRHIRTVTLQACGYYLCEFLFLDNSVFLDPDIEELKGTNWIMIFTARDRQKLIY